MRKVVYTHNDEQSKDKRVMRERDGSNLQLRAVAAALYGIAGIDATAEQLEKARQAVIYYRDGKPVSLIRLLLRIKVAGKAPSRLPCERANDVTADEPEFISLDKM